MRDRRFSVCYYKTMPICCLLIARTDFDGVTIKDTELLRDSINQSYLEMQTSIITKELAMSSSIDTFFAQYQSSE